MGPLTGDVEIGLQERNGQLEVDIIQARGLTAKPGSKTLPGMGTALPFLQGRGGRRGGGPEGYLGLEERKLGPTTGAPLCPNSSDSHGTSGLGFVLGTHLRLSVDLIGLPHWFELLEDRSFPVYGYSPTHGCLAQTG